MSTDAGAGDEFDDDIPAGEDPYLGKPVGSYVISRCLGRGGMGAVYQAEHPSIGSKVAIKFLHRRYSADRAIVERFFNEAKAVNLIGHDNIVKVSDFATLDDGSPYFIMEFLEGAPLAKLVGEAQPLADLGPIFLQLCDALAAAHEKGIIHRDLKPDNIYLVTRNRRANFVKVVDFGIAKLQNRGAGGAKTSTGMVMGTAQYMSPEQAAGQTNIIGPASDVYSVGIILYQMVTGTLPFEGSNFGEILIGHMMKPPTPPTQYVPGLPAELERIILKCLEKKPEDRFASMAELYDAIGALLDAEGLSREPPVAGSGPARPVSRPPMPGPQSSPTGTAVLPAGGGGRMPSSPNGTAAIPAGAGARTPSSPNGTAIISGQTRGQTSPDGPGGTMVVGYEPRKKGPNPAVFVAIGIVLVVAAAGAFVALKRSDAAPAPPAANAAPAPVAAPAPAPPASVLIAVATTPPGARITIVQAGRNLAGTAPASFELTPGIEASAHVEADGHQPLDEKFTPSAAGDLRWTLVPVPTAPAPAPTAAAAPAEPAKTAPAKTKSKGSVGDGMVDVDF